MDVYDMKNLKDLNISSFNTSNVTEMDNGSGDYGMFQKCSSLHTIYVDPAKWNVDNVTASNHMFVQCNNLVGHEGTAANVPSNPSDKTYARIDNPPDAPGYLTDIANKI